MTEKLYYSDSHIMNFSAEAELCFPFRGKYAVVLNRTAFFPEGGGQSADTGLIGECRVEDVQEIASGKLPDDLQEKLQAFRPDEKLIVHFCSQPVAEGTEYRCVLDAEQRLRRMQNHSGEHIVSGLVHQKFGYDNVGFHMSAGFMTIDFSGELTKEQLDEIETEANKAIRSDIEIIQLFPSPDELKNIEYRSKLDLTENVRLVEIPGIDRCACCAPHVKRTGEIGIIKILTSERHRGGVRVTLTCGLDALDDYRMRQQSVAEISETLSAKRDEVSSAVSRLAAEKDALKAKLAEAENQLVGLKAAAVEPREGNICLFENLESEVSRRELVNLLVGKCGGAAAVFCGSDETGYTYVIGSRTVDLRKNSRAINDAIGGRGGGRPEMIMGNAAKSGEEIRAYFENTHLE